MTSTSRASLFADSLVPLATDLRGYTLEKFRGDLVAGLTVAAVAVPQAMAYAIVANVEPVYGLITVIFQSVVGALVASNRLLSVGPINTQSLLVASVAGIVARKVAPGDGAVYLQVVVLLTFFKGVVQLLFAALRLGQLVRYVSVSVTTGFTAGAGVLIAAGQVGSFLGYPLPRVDNALPGLIGFLQRVIAGLGQTDWRSIAIGAVALGIVLAGQRISRLFPGPLVAVLVSGVIVWALGWGESVYTIAPLPAFRIPFETPAFWLVNSETAESIAMGAVALALLGLMESYSIGRSIASRTGDRVSANGELVSQGLTHAITSFLQCIPGSGSFSRSELNYRAGARTVFAGLINGLVVAAVFVAFSDLARYVPMSALAAVLFVIAAGLIDWRFFLRVRGASRSDAIVFGVTLLATLLAPLQYAVYLGILLNIGLYLNQASRLHLAEMIQTTAGPFVERPIHDRLGNKQVMFLQLEGDLFFAVADELRDRLTHLLDGEVRVVIFRLKRTHMIDATVMAVLEWFVREMHRGHRHVILCGVRTDLMRSVKAYGLVDLIGKENVFAAGDNVFSSAKAALARARELVARSIDLQPIHEELQREEAIMYEI